MKKFASCHSIFSGDQNYELLTIETDISSGLFFFKIIGLADRAVQESKFRILSALRNSGFGIPQRRNEKVTVSLLPTYSKKISTYCDLGIAASYLIASKQIPDFEYPVILIGQLGLDGSMQTAEDLSHIIHIGMRHGIRHFIFPETHIETHQHDRAVYIARISNVGDLSNISFKKHMSAPSKILQGHPNSDPNAINPDKTYQIDSLRNIDYHKRALLIALAGRHPILFSGAPGIGKSSLGKYAVELLDPLSSEEDADIQSIYSFSNIPRKSGSLIPPIRSPHHSITRVGMIGGLHNQCVGEISLSNKGILLLDELCEFNRETIESLREVFDSGGVNIRKGNRHFFIPFSGHIIATTNLCPCGLSSQPYDSAITQSRPRCTCTKNSISNYRKKISHPILDRFHIKTVFQPYAPSNANKNALTGKYLRQTISLAIKWQKLRNGDSKCIYNSGVAVDAIKRFGINPEALEAIFAAESKLFLSKRSVDTIFRIARTIADIEQSQEIKADHALEAIQYAKTNPFE